MGTDVRSMSDEQLSAVIAAALARCNYEPPPSDVVLIKASQMERLMRTFGHIAACSMQCSIYADQDGEPEAEHALRGWAHQRALIVETLSVRRGMFDRSIIVRPGPHTLIQAFLPKASK